MISIQAVVTDAFQTATLVVNTWTIMVLVLSALHHRRNYHCHRCHLQCFHHHLHSHHALPATSLLLLTNRTYLYLSMLCEP